MASPVDPTSSLDGTVAQETITAPLSPGSSGGPPSRPVVPPRGSFSPSIKRSMSTQHIAPPQAPTRPSLPKQPPSEAPKKSPPPRAPGSTDLPLSPGLKKARPPSVHVGRPLPTPGADASSSSDHFSAALASSSPSITPPPLSSSPTLPMNLPPAPTSTPSSAPGSAEFAPISRGPGTTSPGLKRPLSFINAPSATPPGSPKVAVRPLSTAPKSSPSIPQQPIPVGGGIPKTATAAPLNGEQPPMVPPKPGTKGPAPGPPKSNGSTPPGSFGKSPSFGKIPTAGSPKSSLPSPPAPFGGNAPGPSAGIESPSPIVRRTAPMPVAPSRAAPTPPGATVASSPSPTSSPATASNINQEAGSTAAAEVSTDNASPRISPRAVPRGSPPPPIVMSAATPRTDSEGNASPTPRQSPPAGVSPLTLSAPNTATTPNGPLSPHSAATSPRQEGFTTGFVKPTYAKRAGVAFGSRSAARTPDQGPESAVVSPRSESGAEATSAPASPRTNDVAPQATEAVVAATPAPAATVAATPVAATPVAAEPSPVVAAVSTPAAPASVEATPAVSTETTAEPAPAPVPAAAAAAPALTGNPLDFVFIGEGTMPPPPPDYEDEPNANGEDESGSGAYSSVLNGNSGTLSSSPSGTFSLMSVLGREDQTGPPPPGLQALPGIFHPVRAPPALPAGVIHPDVLAAQQAAAAAAAAEQPQEDKKKKKGFGALFGVKDKDDKKDEKKDDKKDDKKDKEKDKEAKEKEKAEKEREKQLEKEKKEREKKEKEEKERREKEEKKAAAAAAADEKAGLKGLKKILGSAPDSGRLSHSSSNPNLAAGANGSSAPPSGETGTSPLRPQLDLYSRLMELLCRPDLHLLNITASLVKRGDVDKQSRAWVHLLTPRGRMVDLLGKVIFTEVDKTDHEGTLFRNNTFSVGLMSAFAHEVGRGYLKNLLGPLLAQILTSGLSYEINPEKSEAGPLDEDTVDANTVHLLEACGAYVDAIIKSLGEVPVELRRVCSMLRQYVSTKFPASVNTCVGGFFFLRFLTPAVVSPEGFGVQDQEEPITIEMRRPLILISKTLQQISNEMYFSEDHMMSLNSFITENIPAFQQFFQDICSPTAEDPAAPQFVPYTHEANRSRDDALLRLHAFLQKSLPEIKAVAQVEPAPPGMTYDPIAELEKILTDLGEPQDPKILKAPAAAASATTATPEVKKKK